MFITTFDDFDAFLAAERAAREVADAQVKPWQAELQVGDYFLRILDVGTDYVAIYGQIVAVHEEDQELFDQPHMKHYRPSRCWSEACPEGELGDVHVSSVTCKLSEKQFKMAKAMDWPNDTRVADIVAAK